MPMTDFIRLRHSIQYTGSNGADVSALAGIPIVSDNGVQLKLGDPGSGWVALTFNVTDWFESTDGSVWTHAVFMDSFVSKSSCLQDTIFNPAGLQSQITALNTSQGTQDTAIAAAAAAAAGKLGKVDLVSISVPILLLGGSADRPIVWNRPFSNANYDLSYALDASTIGRITCAPVAGTKTATGITIRVTAGLAVSVLGVVHVLAIGT